MAYSRDHTFSHIISVAGLFGGCKMAFDAHYGLVCFKIEGTPVMPNHIVHQVEGALSQWPREYR